MKPVLSFVFVFLFAIRASAQGAPYPGGNAELDSINCAKYFTLWKDMFMKKSGMSTEYFNSHIHVYEKKILRDYDAEWIRIRYNINIDWMNIKWYDELTIKINSNLWSDLPVRRHEYLNRQEIEVVLAGRAFESRLTTVTPAEHLKYTSLQEAQQAALEKVKDRVTGFQSKNDAGINYYEHDTTYTRGHPYMQRDYYVDAKANKCKCLRQMVALITGEMIEQEDVCVYPHYEK